MGIRGLTSLIARRSSNFFDAFELHDCYLLIDGNNLAARIYKDQCSCNDCFGGDYDEYAYQVQIFFDKLKQCNITPLIVLDGGFEMRKLKTIYDRMRERIKSVKMLNPSTQGQVEIIPLFIRQLFNDLLLRLNIKTVRSDYEADDEMASLSRMLDCPVLSFDSDFYLCNIKYIPFTHLELNILNKNGYNYLRSHLFNTEKFLQYFGGLNKELMPLISVLLGNDYIKQKSFRGLFQKLDLSPKDLERDLLKTLSSIVRWLQKETLHSAVETILSYVKSSKKRNLILQQIDTLYKAYFMSKSDLAYDFGITFETKQQNCDFNFDKAAFEKIVTVDKSEYCSSDEDQISDEEELTDLNTVFPSWFLEKFRKSIFPSHFVDIGLRQKYLLVSIVEKYNCTFAHKISEDLIKANHSLLSNKDNLLVVCRGTKDELKFYDFDRYSKSLPNLNEIPSLTESERRKILLDILKIDDIGFLKDFPSFWHLYLLSVRYWVEKLWPSKHHLYALLLSMIVINHIDLKIGRYRCPNEFNSIYKQKIMECQAAASSKSNDINDALDNLNAIDCLLVMKKLIGHFKMDLALVRNSYLYNLDIVHVFAQFQSIFYHVSYLNMILLEPFEKCLVSDFYNGTFVYNITGMYINVGSKLDSCSEMLLGSGASVLHCFNLITDLLSDEFQKLFSNKKQRCK